MTVCILVGPSIAASDIEARLPGCRILAPARQGSIVDCVQDWSPSVIGLVDGYFLQCPAVWHKEILWALDQGVHVVGASSMGALRAAELAPFGMVGIGKIFDAYLNGALPPFQGIVGDDEVALVHGPAESGYMTVSDALVNIRFTLEAAQAGAVIDGATAESLVTEAVSLHFSERTYVRVIERAEAAGACGGQLSRLLAWLPNGKVDQKRDDALALVDYIAERFESERSPHKPMFNFEETEIFRAARIQQAECRRTASFIRTHRDAVVDELRLTERAYRKAKCTVVAKLLMLSEAFALQGAEHDGQQHEHELLKRTTDQFRRRHGLWNREALDAWLSDNDIGVADLEALLRDETRLRVKYMSRDTADVVAALVDHLKLSGEYQALSTRARRKTAWFEQNIPESVDSESLLYWYFVERAGAAIPTELATHAITLGLAGKEEFVNLLKREYSYLSQSTVDTKSDSGEGCLNDVRSVRNKP